MSALQHNSQTSEPRQEVLVISFSPLHRDPRVRRQIEALSQDYRVHAAGLTDPCLPGVSFTALRPLWANRFWSLVQAWLMLLRCYSLMDTLMPRMRHGRRVLSPLAVHCKVIIANDIDALPLAHQLAGAGVVLYDAHEYSPGQNLFTWRWRFFHYPYRLWACKQWMPRSFRCITVNQPIAEAYRSLCGVSCSISMNMPNRYALDPRPTDPDRIRLIHHGGAAPMRQLERLIAMVGYLDQRFTLTFMLMAPDDSPYLRKLKHLARMHGDRIRFDPPVAFDSIVPTIRHYDMGVCLLPSTTTNLRLALPNKLFEFIQARLAVAVSPNPAMAALVREHGVGIVSDENSPQSMARILNGLTSEQIDQMRQRSHLAAASLNSDVVAADWRAWVAEAMAS
ncbi:hypothetical protein [Synechococcus sp. CBW1004]|uniref:hypothetical protein n=1 Tax=Synechococcus sp. CBW1004 TaxID=1353136 RepID=UPI0018CE1245|nr:hypothetical protein [Synechococcus sp. CBW1004]QPN62474.1 hypothetical protein H8F25_12260 [Synechococcus sp. CBW1004]